MARNDFVYVNINKPLGLAVDSAVEKVRRHGSPVFRDRRHFVETAILEKLSKEVTA